jgi:hypothetical protein
MDIKDARERETEADTQERDNGGEIKTRKRKKGITNHSRDRHLLDFTSM